MCRGVVSKDHGAGFCFPQSVAWGFLRAWLTWIPSGLPGCPTVCCDAITMGAVQDIRPFRRDIGQILPRRRMIGPGWSFSITLAVITPGLGRVIYFFQFSTSINFCRSTHSHTLASRGETKEGVLCAHGRFVPCVLAEGGVEMSGHESSGHGNSPVRSWI